jgi:hypothetical protein
MNYHEFARVKINFYTLLMKNYRTISISSCFGLIFHFKNSL